MKSPACAGLFMGVCGLTALFPAGSFGLCMTFIHHEMDGQRMLEQGISRRRLLLGSRLPDGRQPAVVSGGGEPQHLGA